MRLYVGPNWTPTIRGWILLKSVWKKWHLFQEGHESEAAQCSQLPLGLFIKDVSLQFSLSINVSKQKPCQVHARSAAIIIIVIVVIVYFFIVVIFVSARRRIVVMIVWLITMLANYNVEKFL